MMAAVKSDHKMAYVEPVPGRVGLVVACVWEKPDNGVELAEFSSVIEALLWARRRSTRVQSTV
jgi:hypothetical protein